MLSVVERAAAVDTTLADKIKGAMLRQASAAEQIESARAAWVDATMALAVHLTEARRQHPADIEFNRWPVSNDIDLTPDARAALIALGAEPERARLTLEKSGRTSLRNIVTKEFNSLVSSDERENIYVLSIEPGLVKVGISSDFKDRMSAISNACPWPLTVEYRATVKGGGSRCLEQAAHSALHKHRRNGEWFDVSVATAISTIEQAALSGGIILTAIAGPPPRSQDALGSHGDEDVDHLGIRAEVESAIDLVLGNDHHRQWHSDQRLRALYRKAFHLTVQNPYSIYGDMGVPNAEYALRLVRMLIADAQREYGIDDETVLEFFRDTFEEHEADDDETGE